MFGCVIRAMARASSRSRSTLRPGAFRSSVGRSLIDPAAYRAPGTLHPCPGTERREYLERAQSSAAGESQWHGVVSEV